MFFFFYFQVNSHAVVWICIDISEYFFTQVYPKWNSDTRNNIMFEEVSKCVNIKLFEI